MIHNPPREPLIAIVGATGTGKSQLAVELAKRHNGEIINGDAMQLYAGLPIITNKITLEEQQGIPHHLLGCIGLHEPTWVVGTFVKQALGVIEEIRARGKLPILVGGTHYYTQSLLFHDRLADGDRTIARHVSDSEDSGHDRLPLLEQPTEVLLDQLRRVDPAMAERWHPRDRRKIQRSLEIFLKTGKKASETYAEQRTRRSNTADQHDSPDGDAEGLDVGRTRFQILIFWLHAEPNVLRERLDRRVDKMFDAGLLEEVHTLDTYSEAELAVGRTVDETRGIWVSIGYKEFKDYAHALDLGLATAKELEQLRLEALEKTRVATRQYAKRQLRWIRIKLLLSLLNANALDSIYVVDGSNVKNFSETVVEPARELTQLFLHGCDMPSAEQVLPAAAELLKPKRAFDISAAPEEWKKRHCDACNVTCVVPQQWEQHVNSKAHKKTLSKLRQRETCASSQDVRGE
ncbi:hypothetical protein BAUCODRAFT_146427 [Baudoinia panamericana UAMH 10762]|uniref:tRNA dimethylallyltransferase n=1 Tax=Baudoinia panamericana (strain UAMH 10762) TaxID=717646 RepID=M2NFM8_BAUPA|nr:uncharacterized protein BAUCODRAFT_146427 [Baudoinia panamericana UAMH 10762]EMC97810.1 hypothetical protein BAUCODRAFT_146427 [Baudoinia panamericana UAMH 10762]